MKESDVEQYVKEEEDNWDTVIEYFPDKADYYADLAILVQRFGFEGASARLQRKAASNMISYGHHKDVYLFEILEGIERCHEAGSSLGLSWIRNVAPLIGEVRHYTDGDETSHLPSSLAQTLLKVHPELLKSYYVHAASNEQLFLAESIFPHLIASLDLSEPISAAIAGTAIDPSSLAILQTKGTQGDAHAIAVVQKLSSLFHEFREPPDANSHTPFKSGEKQEVSVNTLVRVKPELLSRKLAKFAYPAEWNGFLLDWLRYWLSGTKTREAYDAAKKWIEYVGPERVDSEIYDLLLPHTAEFDDVNQSFEFLALMFLREYGWSWFSSSKKKIEWIRERLAQDHPRRYHDFILRTRQSVEYEFPYPRYSLLPVQTGTDFLIYFGEIKMAESLVTASVQSVQELMANLKLPSLPWLEKSHQASGWDVLYARLFWPSSIVRERAASELADLLLRPDGRGMTFETICGWLKRSALETQTAILLLPIAKAHRAATQPLDLRLDKLRLSITTPSIVTEHIFREIERDAKQ